MTKMNKQARRVARELKYTGVAIDTTDVMPRGKGDAQQAAECATRLREMFDDFEALIGLLEHELLKLRKHNVALYRELRDEFQMGYLG
ncbi:hypothetical protein PP16_gp27 [Pectobacterium phage PP16]|uniref:Uncharacterized protein n=1 Tax=Pectobacterium phage PP16 TaxID=1873958 RepID=A0A1B1PEC0_9CAUD|nr:hypothetical protein PP16_gp27 [Pectobacterium phage PP16]ANT45326.1 hypothetical protein PP16_gp27 [Pectobacterium phage PP16]